MEIGYGPSEVHTGKNYREEVEICRAENGFIIKHCPNEGSSKTYIAKTHEEAHEIAAECLERSLEKEEVEEKSSKGRSDKYENAY